MKVTTILSLTIACLALSGAGDIAQVAAESTPLGGAPQQSNPDCKFSPCD